jgi:hypothetical protein
MANGLLAKSALAAATYTAVGQVPNGQSGTVNIRIVNRDANNPTTIRLAVTPSSWVSGAPANADYIEPVDVTLPASGVLEEQAIAVSSQEQIVAYAASANVTVRVFGYLK